MAKDSVLVDLLKKYPVFEEVKEYNKLRCTLTGHEVPTRAADLAAYIELKKFKTAFEVYTIRQENPDVFEDLDDKAIVGCKITKTVIAADPADMRRHLAGKKFKRKLAWREKRKEQGLDVSSDEGEGEDDEDMDEDGEKGEGEEGSDESELEELDDDDDEEEEDDGEYPGLGKTGAVSVEGKDSYDFSVMDTELEEAKGGKKKRKGAKNGGGEPAQKKVKKAK